MNVWGYGAHDFKEALLGLAFICVFLALSPIATLTTARICKGSVSGWWCTYGTGSFVTYVLLLILLFGAVFTSGRKRKLKGSAEGLKQ